MLRALLRQKESGSWQAPVCSISSDGVSDRASNLGLLFTSDPYIGISGGGTPSLLTLLVREITSLQLPSSIVQFCS